MNLLPNVVETLDLTRWA